MVTAVGAGCRSGMQLLRPVAAVAVVVVVPTLVARR